MELLSYLRASQMGLVVEGKKISPRNNSIFFQLQWPHTKLQIKENIFTNVKHNYFLKDQDYTQSKRNHQINGQKIGQKLIKKLV